mgnify:FL=1
MRSIALISLEFRIPHIYNFFAFISTAARSRFFWDFVGFAMKSHQEEVVIRPTKFRLIDAPPIEFAFV